MTAQRRPLIECLHIFVLTSFALEQPILYRLARKTVFVRDQDIEPPAILLLVAFLCVIVPALIVWIEWLAGWIGPKARERVHAGAVYLLLAAIAMPVLKLMSFLAGMIVVLLALVVAAVALWMYRRFAMARSFVTAAAPAIVVFPGLFLFYSPTTKLLLPRPPTAPVPVAVNNPVPVVLVVFDEFCGTSLMNAKHEIDAARLPNFAALAETATWYRNASSVNPRSEMAVPAILTGSYPRGRRPATLAEHPRNLFTLLEATSQYELVVFEPYTRLYQPKLETAIERRSFAEQFASLASTLPAVYLDHAFPHDLPFELPEVPLAWNAVTTMRHDSGESRTGVFRHHWNSDRARQFDEFLDRMVPLDRPPLYFAHVAVPHAPWCFLPSGRKYIADDGKGLPGETGRGSAAFGTSGQHSETWGLDELAVVQGLQRYLLQVGFVDRLVGRLVTRLKELDLFDQSLVIVVADHGVSFQPGLSRRLPTDANLAEIASIPLFIKLPGQHEGSISDRNVESIDVLATIVDVLGLDANQAAEGESLVDASRPARAAKTFYSESGPVLIDAKFDAKYAALDRMLARFGPSITAESLCRIGPHPEWIGQSVADLDVRARSDLEITLLHPNPAAANRSDGLMPCYFVGRVRAGPNTPLPVALAIAVNGTIHAVTRTYLARNIREMWSAMVPESSLRTGDNAVQIFAVSANDGKLSLAPTRDEPIVVTVTD